jgi:hypothetical protein
MSIPERETDMLWVREVGPCRRDQARARKRRAGVRPGRPGHPVYVPVT